MRRLRLVLVRTRFPENVGTAARASANFGHAPLFLIDPERCGESGKARAMPLADGSGRAHAPQPHRLPQFLSGRCRGPLHAGHRHHRPHRGLGGRQLFTPGQAAARVAERLTAGEDVALVFGPEDRGLKQRGSGALRHAGHRAHRAGCVFPQSRPGRPPAGVRTAFSPCPMRRACRISAHCPAASRQEERDILAPYAQGNAAGICTSSRPATPTIPFCPLARFLASGSTCGGTKWTYSWASRRQHPAAGRAPSAPGS